MGLEPLISGIGELESDWHWMSTYRTWEANRKVFLYPETYLRPELRKSRTPLFADFEHALSSCEMTKDGLELLYRRYLDQFALISNLQTVGSWYEPGLNIDTYAYFEYKVPSKWITRSSGPTVPYGQLTLEAWVRRGPSPDTGLLLGISGKLCLGISPAGEAYFQLGLTAEPQAVRGGKCPPDEWHHLCGVFSDGKTTLYVDGLLVDDCFFSGQLSLNPSDGFNSPFVIGGSGLKESAAEVRLWTCVRRQEQIVANMKVRVTPTDPDHYKLWGYWAFDPGTRSDGTGNWGLYSRNVEIPTSPPPVRNASPVDEPSAAPSTYYMVGRTRTQPYRFHYRTCQLSGDAAAPVTEVGSVWTPWQAVGVDANTPYMTPVVFNGQLYLFWAETQKIYGDKNKTPPTKDHFDVRLMYSLRTADANWTAPQTPFPTLSLADDVTQAVIDQSCAWNKPYVLPVMFNGSPAILVILFGPKAPVPPPVLPPVVSPAGPTGSPGPISSFTTGTGAASSPHDYSFYVLSWDQSVVGPMPFGPSSVPSFGALIASKASAPVLRGINTDLIGANYFRPLAPA